jgi:MtN3 and saliva related transmembrane protein
MELSSALGFIAATLTTIAFLPQAIRIIRTRHTRDISLAMYVTFTSGIFFWLVYGLLTADLPIIAANTITFIFSFTILMLKIKYK